MEVIIDTCVLINAIFDQPNNEYSWQILKEIRCNRITPVVCEKLLREYICAPQKLVFDELKKKSEKGELTSLDFQTAQEALY